MFEKGTIVLVPFPFTDLSAHKVRPAVIVSSFSGGGDVIVAFISSRLHQKLHPMEVLIEQADPAFANTGLKCDSLIKVDKLATLDKKIILGELGLIDTNVEREVAKKLRRLFGL